VATAPDFIAGRALPERAFDYAFGAHHGPSREGDTNIDHPVAVAPALEVVSRHAEAAGSLVDGQRSPGDLLRTP